MAISCPLTSGKKREEKNNLFAARSEGRWEGWYIVILPGIDNVVMHHVNIGTNTTFNMKNKQKFCLLFFCVCLG